MSVSDPRIGSQIGEYSVDDLLGEGGMGKVYTATGPDGGRVALKLVKDDYARDETFRRRFYREARIAQTVKHPNVVPVLDTGEVDGLPYMAQRYIEGMSLDEKLKRDGPLDAQTAVQVCTDVAAGLEALWAAGMVHRDVKPANILLDAERPRLHHRLRPGQGHPGKPADAAGPGARVDGLHGPRADPRRAGHRRHRHLRAGVRDVRVHVRASAVRRGAGHADPVGAPAGPAAGPRGPRAPDMSDEFARTLLTALEKDSAKRPQTAGEYARMLAAAV